MLYLNEKEQIEQFYQDPLIQKYIKVLKTLISKKSIFAQQIGLEEVADYLETIFVKAGAEVTVDKSYCAPFVVAHIYSV